MKRKQVLDAEAEFLHGLARRCDRAWMEDTEDLPRGELFERILTEVLGPVLEESNKMADILAGDVDCRWDKEYRAAWAAACAKVKP